ncbi:hypothetical protein IT575_12230 [bacterium]|nr:hypothetical protein [bacterium]
MLLLSLYSEIDWSGIVQGLGGWPVAALCLFLVLAAIVLLAWAPVAAIRSILQDAQLRDAARQEAELERAKVEAQARVDSAKEHRAGLDKVASSSEHVADAVSGLSGTLGGMQSQLTHLEQQGAESNSKLTKANETLALINDRTRRNSATA